MSARRHFPQLISLENTPRSPLPFEKFSKMVSVGKEADRLIIPFRGGSPLKGLATRTLSEFGRESLLLVLKFQLNSGHPQKLWTLPAKASLLSRVT